MSRTVLVTGANGFIGRAITAYLEQSKGNVVWTLTRKGIPGRRNIVLHMNHSQKLVSALEKIQPDVIFHCAGGRMRDEKKLYRSNLMTTQALFDALAKAELKPRIVMPGTAAEYGPVSIGNRMITESQPPKPAALYGFVKLMQTHLSLMYARQDHDVVIARIFNIGGPGTPDSLAVGRFAKEIARLEPRRKGVKIRTGNLDGKRDFLDITDVCAALDQLSRKGKKAGIYNICSGEAWTMRELLDKMILLSRITDITIEEDVGNAQASFDTRGSNARIKRATGWSPKVSIDEMLKRTLNNYRKVK